MDTNNITQKFRALAFLGFYHSVGISIANINALPLSFTKTPICKFVTYINVV
jgi:hypothetical protein